MKESNPKDAIGADKLPLHLWPPAATAMGCIGLAEGATKYGRANWRAAGIRASIYYDACRRHLDAWFEGEEVAPDSGVPHLANALACLAIIVDAQSAGKLVDDRNYQGDGYRALVEALTPYVARLKELHADKAPKHWDMRESGLKRTEDGYLVSAPYPIDPISPLTSVPGYHRSLPDGVTWASAPERAQWFAIDRDGWGHWFQNQPKIHRSTWWSKGESGSVDGPFNSANWCDSLRRRPAADSGQSDQHYLV